MFNEANFLNRQPPLRVPQDEQFESSVSVWEWGPQEEYEAMKYGDKLFLYLLETSLYQGSLSIKGSG